ncbi:hypothetical protein HXX76_015490 [Chlamydomonas incerta]|uniref:Uncharacterized protein n=1 Tax=Chlamydomonas incerta TaxID=51695 RepID=A0A835SAB1_CHLIN|nr:hypothetical protein HXX76_015490 [Chlamydomonas incerta]|eukprot:KAG2423234.1 hypothetical protein HXX76_015490 [Chlamydomonas incerta]
MATKDDIRQLKEDTRLLKEAMATKDDIRQLKEDTRLLKEAVDKLASQSKSDWSMALSGAFGGLLPIAGMVAMKMLTDQTPK